MLTSLIASNFAASTKVIIKKRTPRDISGDLTDKPLIRALRKHNRNPQHYFAARTFRVPKNLFKSYYSSTGDLKYDSLNPDKQYLVLYGDIEGREDTDLLEKRKKTDFPDFLKSLYIDEWSTNIKARRKALFDKAKRSTDVTRLHDEVAEGMGHRYKIHLQIKPEYLVSFINDFMKLLKEERRLSDIFAFKFYNYFIPNLHIHINQENNAIVVLYVKLLPGSIEEKTEKLKTIILAIAEHYREYLDTIHLPITPRFNRQVIGFIYLAGSDANDKILLNDKIKEARTTKEVKRLTKIKETLFTDDLAFFRKYKIDTKKLKKSIQKHLEALKKKNEINKTDSSSSEWIITEEKHTISDDFQKQYSTSFYHKEEPFCELIKKYYHLSSSSSEKNKCERELVIQKILYETPSLTNIQKALSKPTCKTIEDLPVGYNSAWDNLRELLKCKLEMIIEEKEYINGVKQLSNSKLEKEINYLKKVILKNKDLPLRAITNILAQWALHAELAKSHSPLLEKLEKRVKQRELKTKEKPNVSKAPFIKSEDKRSDKQEEDVIVDSDSENEGELTSPSSSEEEFLQSLANNFEKKFESFIEKKLQQTPKKKKKKQEQDEVESEEEEEGSDSEEDVII